MAAQHPDIVAALKKQLVTYARQQKMSLWLQVQPGFLSAQGKSVLDPSYDIGDGGLPHEKTVLPKP